MLLAAVSPPHGDREQADDRSEQGEQRPRLAQMDTADVQIIRAGDYADPYLAKLGIDAVDMWRESEWEGTYHESVLSGFIGVTADVQVWGDSSISSR